MDKSKVYLWIPGLNALLFCPLCPLSALYPGAGRIQQPWAVLAKPWPTDALDSLQSPRKHTRQLLNNTLYNKSKSTLGQDLIFAHVRRDCQRHSICDLRCQWLCWCWKWSRVFFSPLILTALAEILTHHAYFHKKKNTLTNPGSFLRNSHQFWQHQPKSGHSFQLPEK